MGAFLKTPPVRKGKDCMNTKQNLKLILIMGLFLMSLGGWLLHWRTHPPTDEARNWIPFIAGLGSTLMLPLLFWFKRTLVLAYVVNGMLVIIGLITMAHFSLANWPGGFSLRSVMLGTLLPDMLILCGNFGFGKALFELNLLHHAEDKMRHGRFWRYPNMGWWWVHLVALSVVYALGHVLWS